MKRIGEGLIISAGVFQKPGLRYNHHFQTVVLQKKFSGVQHVGESMCHAASHHLAVKAWQDFFVEEEAHLYQWVSDRRVPCENNGAERELRPTVIARKVSHGSQAEEGAKIREVLMSIMQTLRKRVADPRQKFKAALDEIALNAELKVTDLLFNVDDG